MAAVKIQAVVRRFLQKRRTEKQNRAVVVIQAMWRGFAARNRLKLEKEAQLRALQHKVATIIQVGTFFTREDENIRSCTWLTCICFDTEN